MHGVPIRRPDPDPLWRAHGALGGFRRVRWLCDRLGRPRLQELRLAWAATLATWLMTLFIQRADRRDTLAIHAKLDELLKATRTARTELAAIDEREPEVIEKIRDRERRDIERS